MPIWSRHENAEIQHPGISPPRKPLQIESAFPFRTPPSLQEHKTGTIVSDLLPRPFGRPLSRSWRPFLQSFTRSTPTTW